MRALEFLSERAERARDAIENIVTMGNINDYFVRFTDVDKLGYSAQQDFGRMPDIGDADWNPDALPKKKGHPALWFYPASYYLKHKDLFADSRPYVWLVKRRDNAYLQPTQGATRPEVPPGMIRAGLMHKESGVPVAVFFRPEFDVVDRWHEPHPVKENFADKKVKGKSRPGRVKRAGASCKGSVSSLRAKARKYGGEKGKMYHWCANMKSGRSKK